MKRMNLSIVFLLTVATGTMARNDAEQPFSEGRLQQACETLQRAPLETAGVQTLLDASRFATNSPALRSRAMAAYSLNLLIRGNTNAFEHAVQIQRATYPNDQALVSVNQDAYLALCDDCKGTGLTTTLCPTCMGLGKCPSCAGLGIKKLSDGADAPCPACKRSGICAMCEGKKRIETPCPTCKGFCRVFKLSDKVRANYLSLLTNIVAICQENKDFADQFTQAQIENNPALRLSKLHALIQRFAHRTDLTPAKDLLEKELKKREELASAQRLRREQEQSQREIESLRELKDSKDTAQSVLTLRAYLAGHPDSANRMEAQALLSELDVRQTRKQTMWRIAYGVLALIGVLLLIQFFKTFLLGFRRPKVSVRDLDKTQYSDPLTLTAKESKDRVKTKTANIKIDRP